MKSRNLIFLVLGAVLFQVTITGAQQVRLFNIDASGFPTIRAEIDVYGSGGELLPIRLPEELLVTEFGEELEITALDCPPPQEPVAISVVLMVDASTSMEVEAKLPIAEFAARAWLEAMPLDPSECAIATFSHFNRIRQDFTTDRLTLEKTLENIRQGGGTEFNAAFLDPPAGAFLLAKRARHKRVVVVFSDGDAEGDEQDIIQAAFDDDIVVYSVGVKIDVPGFLKTLADTTGGIFFDNVTTIPQAEDALVRILRHAQEVDLCTLEWQSPFNCKRDRNPLAFAPTFGAVGQGRYQAPERSVPVLVVEPSISEFGPLLPGSTDTRFVTLRARNAEICIDALSDADPSFRIIDYGGAPPPFCIEPGASRRLTVEFAPADSGFIFSGFGLEGELCEEMEITVSGGFPGVAPSTPTLLLTVPNGGEVYGVGQTVDIEWRGVPRAQAMRLEYSTDAGASWNRISDDATELRHAWRVPNTPSDRCLARVTQGAFPEDATDGWRWARNGGGLSPFTDEAKSLAIDINNNLYAVGDFHGSAQFDDERAESVGLSDIFVVKYDSQGQVLWLQRAGGEEGDVANAVAVAPDGGIVVCGEFSATASFEVESLRSRGARDIFVVKYDAAGRALWARSAGSDRGDNVNCIAIDAAGDIYISGEVQGSARFGSRVIAAGNPGSMFLAKYSAEGNELWAKGFAGPQGFRGIDLTTTSDGELLLTGVFSGDVDIDAVKLSSAGGIDVFLSQFSPEGELRWALRDGGAANDIVSGLSRDDNGNMFLTGYYSGPATRLAGRNLNSAGLEDIFLAKYGADGSPAWALTSGGLQNDRGAAVAASPDGHVFVTGQFQARADFQGQELNGRNDADLFVAKYDGDGVLNWLRSAGDALEERPKDIVYDGAEFVYFTGGFVTQALFGDTLLRALGVGDAFVASMRDRLEPLQQDVSDAEWSIVRPELSEINIDMGEVLIGGRKDSTLTAYLRNVGVVPAAIDNLVLAGLNGDEFQIASEEELPLVIPVDGRLPLSVSFLPQALGLRQAQINIESEFGPSLRTIQGIGIAQRLEIAVEGGILDFGGVEIGGRKELTGVVTLRNISEGTVTIDRTEQLGPDLDQFEVLSGGGSFELASGASHTMSLAFAPLRLGRSGGQLGFFYDGLSVPAVLQLFGEGLQGLVFIPDNAAAPGEQRPLELRLSRPLTADLAGSVSGFRARLRFNASILQPQNSALNSAVNGSEHLLSIESGFDVGGDLLFTTPVLAMLGNAETTEIEILDFSWLDAEGQTLATNMLRRNGNFRIEHLCRQGGTRLFDSHSGAVGLIQLGPSPAVTTMLLEYGLVEAGHSELRIIDSFGRQVRQLFASDVYPGRYTLEIDTDGLSAGSYFLLLRTPTQYFTRQFEIIR